MSLAAPHDASGAPSGAPSGDRLGDRPRSPFHHAPLLPTLLLVAIWAAAILAQASYFRHLKPLAQAICVLVQLVPLLLRHSRSGRVASGLAIFFVLATVGVGASTTIAELISPRPPFVDHYRPHAGPLIAGGLIGFGLAVVLTPLYLRSRWREADRDAQVMAISALVLLAAAAYVALLR